MNAPNSTTDPRFAHRARRPGLDLLRAAAIVLVAFYHAGNFGFVLPYRIQRFGWIGVDLFFVLSGYLISGQLFASIRKGRDLEVKRFFVARALRILPAYLVVLAVYLLFPSIREYPEISPPWKFFAFLQNIGLHGGTAFSHAWSLCIEAQFYLALPFILLAVRHQPRAALVFVLVILASGILLRATIAMATVVDGVVPFRAFQSLIYYPTWARLEPLIAGVVLAAIERFRPQAWSRCVAHGGWLGLAGIGLIVYALYLGESALTVAVCTFQFSLIAAGMAGLVIFALAPQLPFASSELPGAAFLASIAYSLYLSHKIAIGLSMRICQRHAVALTSPVAFTLWIGLAAIVGVALFFTVERPFLAWRQRRLEANKPKVTLVNR